MIKEIELPAGYQQTEIGIVPHDWEVTNVGELLTVKHGRSQHGVIDENGDYPILATGGQIGTANSFIYNKPSVLIGRKGTIDEPQYTDTPFWSIDTLFYTEIFEKSIPKFIYYKFKTIKWYAYNEASGVPSLNAKTIEKIRISIPPLQEQTAIAITLSDTDTLIGNFEKLIEKKRNIKQGVMQELLTGRKRLAGFNGKWKEKKLGDMGKTYGGLSGKSKKDFEDGKHPYIPFLNILNNPIIDCNFFDYVSLRTEENQNKARKGDLFFNGSSETPEEVGMCSVLLDEISNLYLNSFCFGFRLFNEEEASGLYLSYFFRSNEGRKLIYSLAQGATRYNLSKTNFLKLVLQLPEPKEQVAIAKFLFDMDTEIISLEHNQQKLRVIKQGMMQALLTGKIRLV